MTGFSKCCVYKNDYVRPQTEGRAGLAGAAEPECTEPGGTQFLSLPPSLPPLPRLLLLLLPHPSSVPVTGQNVPLPKRPQNQTARRRRRRRR